MRIVNAGSVETHHRYLRGGTASLRLQGEEADPRFPSSWVLLLSSSPRVGFNMVFSKIFHRSPGRTAKLGCAKLPPAYIESWGPFSITLPWINASLNLSRENQTIAGCELTMQEDA
jgi:hypothetical protein